MVARKRTATCVKAALIGCALIVNSGGKPALSQERLPCGERADILAQLLEKYGETLAAAGLTRGGSVIELTTAESGSWTIFISFPNGRACLMAMGDSWEALAKPAGKPI